MEIVQNGGVYFGDVKGMIPHGKGKYRWSISGTVYEGDWEEGKMTGIGKITWSSGISYEGDFCGGFLNGFGTMTNPDGSTYVGSWRLNIQHGFGRKKYSNSDIYDGSWKEGAHEGSGKYAWSNGNMYIGNWKGGVMCGRGVMKWTNGDLFDGYWSNGYRHGSGVYRFADGSYYYGMWTRGLKDGRGTLYPAGIKSSRSSRRLGKNKFKSLKHTLSRKISITGLLFVNSGQKSSKRVPLDEDRCIGDSTRELSTLDDHVDILSHAPEEVESEVDDDSNATVICEREYIQGILIKERTNTNAGLSHKREQQRMHHTKNEKKKSSGDISDGIKSYYLMLNLQLGIR